MFNFKWLIYEWQSGFFINNVEYITSILNTFDAADYTDIKTFLGSLIDGFATYIYYMHSYVYSVFPNSYCIMFNYVKRWVTMDEDEYSDLWALALLVIYLILLLGLKDL